MVRRDFHTHTTFSDGNNTPQEMIEAAIAAGLTDIGISDHSYTSCDESYCIARDAIDAYWEQLASLKDAYRDRIRVHAGIEQDYYADFPAKGADFIIGSVHYLRVGEAYIPVDESAESLRNAVSRYFGGDVYAMTEAYYRTVADVVRRTHATIIGHFDLIAKFNESSPLFDEQNPRYRAAWRQAADALLQTDAVFELNTGAVSRGYRTSPYPSAEIRDYLRAHGQTLLPASDSHSTATLCYAFDRDW